MADVFDSIITRHPSRFILLAIILLLGFGLRTHAVEDRSLWADEGWTMLLSEGPGLDDITRTMAADQHPPLFFMTFRLWRTVAGDSEFATRFFSVLIGVSAVAIAFQLGRTLFNAEAGLLAALLLALADNHIDLSQEVRHYAALTTLAILSSLFYVRWWRRPTRTNRIGYVLASTLLLYTHYLGGFVLIAQLVHMVIAARPWRRLVEAVFLFGAACAGFLPWMLVVLDQNRLRWDNPLYYQNALPNNMDTYRAVRAALFGSQYGLMAGLLLLGLVYVTYRRGGERLTVRLRPLWPVVYPAIWIALTTGITVIINENKQFLTVRNFILITPAVVVLVAHGLTNIQRPVRVFLVSIIVIVGLTTVDSRRHYPDWRAVTRNITDYHLDGEPVLIDVWVGDFPVRYYIDQQMGEDTPRVSLREWRDVFQDQFMPHLLGYLQQTDAFWLVYWGDNPMDEYGDLISQAGFQRTASLSVDHMGTPLYSYRYDKLTGAREATFGDLFTLRKVNTPHIAAPGDTLTVTLWWTAEQQPTLDYSVSVFVLDPAGALVAQHDAPPMDGASPTSVWLPGDLKYDVHRVTLPPGLAPGDYELGLKVYWYGDGEPLPVAVPVAADDTPGITTGGDYASLGTVEVTANP
ncbi:MAG: glycosyltransferase family 39 protein [Anaerolineae bacterium]|nr:glycosyltransferase family 39 protein [Anaerolineae bacterium]